MNLPPHLTIPPLSELAVRMLTVIARDTLKPGTGGYLTSWHIDEALKPTEFSHLNQAEYELKRAGLIEELSDLGYRYRLTLRGVAVAALRDAQALYSELYELRRNLTDTEGCDRLHTAWPQYEAGREKGEV